MTKVKLDEQINNYQKLVKDYDKKLNESVQFQELKKMLQEKNKLLISLKKKIASLESDTEN